MTRGLGLRSTPQCVPPYGHRHADILSSTVKPPGSGWSEWSGQNALEGYRYRKDHEGWKCVFYKPSNDSELKSAQILEETACSNVSLALLAVLCKS